MTPDEIEKMQADIEAGTPGPWFVEFEEEDDFEGVPISDGSSGAPIANVPVDFNDREEREANARRIARVPELEAEVMRLREALREIATGPDHLHDANVARAALNISAMLMRRQEDAAEQARGHQHDT